jgi:hypothetical protein
MKVMWTTIGFALGLVTGVALVRYGLALTVEACRNEIEAEARLAD